MPYDPGINTTGPSAGKQVYLSGVPGLAAGYYTLLPGIYAQLPGAFLVNVQTTPGAATIASTHAALPSQQLPDGSFRAGGYAPTKHTAKFTVKSDLAKITAFRLELMNDANLPANGPGRSLWGTCALTEFKVEVGSKDRKALKLARASADFEQSETPLESYYDDRSGKRRIVGPAGASGQALRELNSMLDDPHVQVRWRWSEGDVVIWDETSTCHRALTDHHPQRRVMRRCVTAAR